MSCTKSKSKPGPRPTSCLTCRQRRKKCDLSRPHCGRCLKSGFECLGYGDDEPRARHHLGGSNALPRPILPAVPTQAASLETPGCGGIESSETPQDLSSVGNSRNSDPPILAAALICELDGYLAVGKEDQTSTHSSEYFNRLWPQDQTQPTVYRRVPFRRSSNTGRLGQAAGIISRDSCLGRIIETLRWTLPPSVDGRQVIRDNHFAHIIYEYRFQRCNLWFMTPPTSIRDLLIDRLKVSKTMMWTMWLGTKLFEAVSRDPRGEMVRECIGWMDKLERGFTTDSHGNPPLHHVADHLLSQLELAYLKFTTIGSASGYALLQKALPRFLQVVAADPTLFMEHPDGNLVVSFPRAISSPQHELERFVIYDAAASFLLGVPPLVEYGYEENYHGVSHGFEWIHGIPFTLVEAISQINSWRAGSRVAPLDNWEGLERRVLAWQPQPAVIEDEENTLSSVARLAVQESWRHVVLIYLYMGMCGVSSHDSRVQASIRQTIRLSETVADLPIGIHMFTHCLVAGIGARPEKYRSLMRERLLSFKDTRVWLFRRPQFSKVLDHLWHGVGAGGEPVMWDDYVHSRCVVVPI